MKRFAIAVALFSTAASAQSALLVTCADCVGFQGIEVFVDGMPVGAEARPHVRAPVSPGNHDVKVFKGNALLVSQVLTVPAGTEVRASVKAGKLELYGNEKLEVSTAPSKQAVQKATELVDAARTDLKQARELNEGKGSSCQARVAEHLDSLGDRLNEIHSGVDAELLGRISIKATDTQKLVANHCPARVKKPLTQKLGKLVARLDKASKTLRQ
jgi:hypothetical protein